MDYEKYRVEYNGDVTYLNHRLVAARNIDDATLELIKESHCERLRLFQQARAIDDVAQLKQLAQQFDALEFEQQQLWGFDRDANFHRWFDFPKCTCPKLDNAERLGTPYRVYNQTCPIHGNQADVDGA